LGFPDVLGVLGLLGLLVARFVPVATLPFWGCAIREMTGWPCPACGLTRVADHVSHGNLAAAWEANPLGTVAASFFALLAVAMVVHLAFGWTLPRVELTGQEAWWLRVSVAVLAVLNYAWVAVSFRFPQGWGAG